MKVKIISQKYNPLLKRKEISFQILHEERKGTPSRLDVRNGLTSFLNVNPKRLYIKRLETKTGTMIAVGKANVYDVVEQALLVEPKYLVARNTPPETMEKEK